MRALILSAALLLTACAPIPAATAQVAEVVELRTWDLPPGYAERLASSLNRVLRRDDVPVGRATEGPMGALVVVAPVGVLDGVDEVVRRATQEPAAPAPRNVQLDYWVVRAVPNPDVDVGPGLGQVMPALLVAGASDGPHRYTLESMRVLRTLDGERGVISGPGVRVEQIVAIEPGSDTVVADVEVELEDIAEIRTRLAVPAGETVVLAQSLDPDADGAQMVYLVIRPTVLAAK